jgi:glyoxylase-like metal-dependent hydrolase (beta-lactamase superfamily II)
MRTSVSHEKPASAESETDATAKTDVHADADGAWGEVFVTRKCCGAANCRNFAPEIFGEVAPPAPASAAQRGRALPVLDGSYEPGAFTGVIRQPRTKEDYIAARTAAAGCGFGAIRIRKPSAKLPPDARGSAWQAWPRLLEDNVWALGQPSTKNYGALAYFLELPGGGVLVDLPKPSEELFRWLEEHGGVRWIFLTHKDHVQHHAEFAARFPGCRRVMGSADVNKHQSSFADATDAVEIKIADELVPRSLDGAAMPEDAIADAELVVLPQPGHTPGGLCLLYRGKFLFTGDHLAYSKRLGHAAAHRLQCWEDWERQTRSVRQLEAWAEAGHLRFQWLLPGHGEWVRLEGDAGGDGSVSAATTHAELRRTTQWMSEQPPGNVPLLRWIPFVISRAKPRGAFGRMVLAMGGAGREAWLLPSTARPYLTDYQPALAGAAVRRLYVLAVAALATVSVAAWLVARAH